MNAQEYVRQEMLHSYYHGLIWREGTKNYIGKSGNILLDGVVITEEQFEMIEDGLFMQKEIEAKANQLLAALEKNAREWFKEWDIPMHRYDFEIDFHESRADIAFTHKKTRASLYLGNVIFSDLDGEILQANMGF